MGRGDDDGTRDDLRPNGRAGPGRRRDRPAGPRAPAARPLELPPGACRRRREALGLTPGELARRAGVQELTVVRFEAAAVRPRQVTVVALHNALRKLEAASG